MLKELYNDFREPGYKLGDNMGKWSQRLVSKLPFADKLSDEQKAYPGAFAALYMGAAFTASFAMTAVLSPVIGVAMLATGSIGFTAGAALTVVGSTAIFASLAAFSKGVLDGGEKHIGFIAEARALIKEIRTAFMKPEKEPAPNTPQAAPAVAPAPSINAAPAGDAFKSAAPRSDASANDDVPAAQQPAARTNTSAPKPRG